MTTMLNTRETQETVSALTIEQMDARGRSTASAAAVDAGELSADELTAVSGGIWGWVAGFIAGWVGGKYLDHRYDLDYEAIDKVVDTVLAPIKLPGLPK